MQFLKNRYGLLLFIMLVMAIIVHTVAFINTEQHIYFWDYNGYWRIWENFSRLLRTDPVQFFAALKSSILNEDYNALPVALITPFYYSGLPSRLAYILALQLVYFLPVIFLFYKSTKYAFAYNSSLTTTITLFMAGSYVAFWAPTLKGYPDISGLVGILLAIILVLKTPLTKEIRWKTALLIGLCLWSAFLFRRWYAFTVVSLYLTLPILNFFLYSEKKHRFKDAKYIIISFFISGISSIALAIIFQKNLIIRVLTTDYSVIYSAYQSLVSVSIYNTIHGIGVYVFLFFIVGIIACFFEKNIKSRTFVIFCLCNLIISFYLFTKTQSPGVQHIIPFAAWVLFVAVYAVYKIQNGLVKGLVGTVFATAIILFSVVVNIITTVPWFQNSFAETKLLPTRSYPLHIENYENYVSLIDKLEALTKGNNDKIAVFSSSGVLNDDMIKTMARGGLDNAIEYTSQVDLRDGIRLEPLNARYVIVVDPVQTHILASGQQVITIPANALLGAKNIGRAYQRLETSYSLSRNSTAYIYEKVRNFTPEEYRDFIGEFSKSYPDWFKNYTSGLKATWISATIVKGDIWGEFNIGENGVISAHPGEHRPTIVKWRLDGVKTLSISSVSTSCPDADGVDVTVQNDAGHALTVTIPDGETRQLDLHDFNGKLSTLTIDKRKTVSCDSITIQ